MRRFQKAVNATVSSIRKPMIEKFPIPIPPLPIQEEIVKILDSFTELEAELELKLQAELEARRKQYEYYRNKLLTPVEHNGRWYLNGKEVEWKKLGEVAKIFDGTHQTPNYTDPGVPFVSVENIKNIYSTKKFISYDDFNKYKVKPRRGDLFMTRMGDIGTCAVIENDDPLAYYVTLALIRIEQNIITPNYLKYLIESNIGKSELNKRILVNATPIKINLGDIGKINIPIPPLSEQERIVAILDKFDVLVNDLTSGLPAEIEARRKQYEYYRNKLLQFPPSQKR
jgi:type I restriction enzyme S subunit